MVSLGLRLPKICTLPKLESATIVHAWSIFGKLHGSMPVIRYVCRGQAAYQYIFIHNYIGILITGSQTPDLSPFPVLGAPPRVKRVRPTIALSNACALCFA